MPSPNPPVSIAAWVDHAGNVLPGMVCDGCGYDLRGQHATAKCPECGLGIEPMLYGMALAEERRPWIAITVAGGILLFPVLPAIMYVLDRLGWIGETQRTDWFDILMPASSTAIVAAGGLALLGAVLEHRKNHKLRFWSVAPAIVLAAMSAIYFLLGMEAWMAG